MVGAGDGCFFVCPLWRTVCCEAFVVDGLLWAVDAGLIVSRFHCLFICLLPVDPGFPVISSGQS